MNRTQWRAIVALAAAVAVAVPAGLAWACVGIISLNTVSATVDPGGTVTVIGREFAQGAPVEIRLDSPTGPVLAVAPPPESTMTSEFRLDVPIPSDVEPGAHVLIATQQYHNMNVGAPARAMLYVGTSAPAAPAADTGAERPVELLASSGPSVASLALIALGVAALSLLLAALWSRVASRPRAAVDAA